MPPPGVSESTVEAVALDWLKSLGWAVHHGPDIAPDTAAAERDDYGEIVHARRLRTALARLNPNLPDDAIEDALRQTDTPGRPTLEARNRNLHRLLVAGTTVEHVDPDGRVRGAQVRVLDFGEPAPADENATISSAFQQLQTYKAEIPLLFTFNAALVVSDGLEARIGALTAGQGVVQAPWRTIAGEKQLA